MTNNRRYTFKKQERLKSRKAIEQLFKEGRSYSFFPLRVVYRISDDHIKEPLRAGFTVSTRFFKKSVDRNRIKRQMREAYRMQKNQLSEYLQQRNKSMALFFIYVGNELPEYAVIASKINALFGRIKKLLNESF